MSLHFNILKALIYKDCKREIVSRKGEKDEKEFAKEFHIDIIDSYNGFGYDWMWKEYKQQ